MFRKISPNGENKKYLLKKISMLFSVNVENGNPIHPPSPQN
jgi:hypothetical protein